MKPVIYKITAPSGKVYIGQTWNISNRKAKYKRLDTSRQPKLHSSLKRYGWDAHLMEIVHCLPLDCSQNVLDNYEIFYIKQYKDCGIEVLNLNDGGRGARLTDETKKKISDTKKLHFKDNKVALERMSQIAKIKSPELRQKQSEFMKRMKIDRPESFISMSKKLKEIKSSNDSRMRHSSIMKKLFLDKERLENNRNQKTNKKVLCVNTNQVFNSIAEVERVMGIHNVSLVCKGIRPHTKGYKFLFV